VLVTASRARAYTRTNTLYKSAVRLDDDDVAAVQALYGRRDTKKVDPDQDPFKPVTRIGTPDIEEEEICTNSSIDSIITTEDGSTYTFKGEQYCKLTDESIAPGYPKNVKEFWSDLPGKLETNKYMIIIEKFKDILMPHSPGLMGSHISSKETSTGDLPMERRTQTIQN
jgi:hypothetical protein